jgi:TP901 family phage tail tape measure protein
MSVKTASLQLRLIDGVSGPAKEIGGVLGRLNAAVTGFAANQRSMDQLRGRMLDAAASAWALQRALSAPIKSAMAFESAMADVTKVVEFGTPEGMVAFKKELLDLSARLPVAVTGLAEIAAAAGQAGIAANELVKFTEGAAKIGVAFDIAAGTAGDAMAKLRTGLGYSTDQVFRLADAMNELSNRQASSASDVLDFTTRVGAQAKMFGFAAEQAAAFGSAMIAAGAAPDVAGTSFLNMGRALTKGASATKGQRAAFQALGLESKKVAAAMQKDAVGTTLDVMDRIAKAPVDQRASLVSQLFGDEARALGPLLTNLGVLRESLGIVADETTYAGSASKEYEARSKTAANAMQLFRNRIERLSISIGNALLPALTSIMDILAPFVDRLSDFAAAYPRLTSAIVGTTAALVAFRIAAIGAAFAAGTLRAGAFAAAIVGLRGIAAAAAIGTAALWPLRTALAATSKAWALFALSARIGGIGTALAAVGSSALALLNPLKLASAAIRGVGIALRFAFIASGVGAIIAGIAAAGTLIYQNWDGIGEMFKSFGSSFLAALGPARPIVEGFGTAISTIADKVISILGPLDASGASWRAWGATLGAVAGGGVASLVAGIDKIVGAIRSVIEWARAGADALANFFGASAKPNTGQLGTPPPGISGARADGGPVIAGKSYLIGERGPEIFKPRQNGHIVPNHELGQAGLSFEGSGEPGREGAPGRDGVAGFEGAPGAPGAASRAEQGYRAGPVVIEAPISISIKVDGSSAVAVSAALGGTLDRQLKRSAQIAFSGIKYGDV